MKALMDKKKNIKTTIGNVDYYLNIDIIKYARAQSPP